MAGYTFLCLRKRAEFLKVARGRKWHDPLFLLQFLGSCRNSSMPVSSPRFGFTVTKKIGGAVVRNRVRRRLREALRHVLRQGLVSLPEMAGQDYVFVARIKILEASFEQLVFALVAGLKASIADLRTRRTGSGG